MKTGTRLYINITNRCNTTCPFCCMYSGVSKTTEMPFETFKNIIDENEGEFELQLEGGEPLLNKNIYLFIEKDYRFIGIILVCVFPAWLNCSLFC